MLIAIRVVAGAMQANLAVANAYGPTSRLRTAGKRFGMMGAMFGVGFIRRSGDRCLLGSINLRPALLCGRRTRIGSISCMALRIA